MKSLRNNMSETTSKQRKVRIRLWHKIAFIFLGLFIALILIEAGLRISGFILLSLQEYRNMVSIKQNGEYRIMCLGESTTQRQYPALLEEILNQRSIGIRFSVIDKGIAGTNTGSILSQLEANLDKYKPDIVVTMMGITDYGGYMPYGRGLNTQTALFFKSFRTYKLARLLWLHIVAKAKEAGFYKPKKNTRLTQGLEHNNAKKDNLVQPQPNLKNAPGIVPDNSQAYVELGSQYRIQGKLSEAEEAFKKAAELNPRNYEAYIESGWLYFSRGDNPSHAEESFKKAAELNPNSWQAYVGLGWSYLAQNKFSEAEDALKKAVELNPENWRTYNRLGDAYFYQGKFPEAEEVCKKALELDYLNDRLLGKLAVVYGARKDYNLSKEYFNKANELRMKYYSPSVVNDYKRLKEALDKKGIYLICVQYPMRSIEPLKKIFAGEKGISFVDNEEIFKRAVQREGYREYFQDIFGGEFGHCTEKGNRLLAENIAKTILREVFNR